MSEGMETVRELLLSIQFETASEMVGGHLTSIHSQAEQDFLNGKCIIYVLSRTHNVFIDLFPFPCRPGDFS